MLKVPHCENSVKWNIQLNFTKFQSLSQKDIVVISILKMSQNEETAFRCVTNEIRCITNKKPCSGRGLDLWF